MDIAKELFEFKLNSPIECTTFVIDDFYENPDAVRNFALSQEYYNRSNVPGKRTNRFYIEEVDKYLKKFTKYYTGNEYNGHIMSGFQYNTSKDQSWYHIDGTSGYAAIIYLTPDAPHTAGTGLFKHESGITDRNEVDYLTQQCSILEASKYELNRTFIDQHDHTKWMSNIKVANVYNRLVIYKMSRFHRSLDYFGYDINNSRLMQIIFF